MSNKPYVPPKVVRHRSEPDYPEWTRATVQSVRGIAELNSPRLSFSPDPVLPNPIAEVEPTRNSSSLDPHDARRSPRILASLPLEVQAPGNAIVAWTAVINLNGALILSAVNWPQGAELEFRNARTDVRVRGRVVWSGDIGSNGLHKLGVEFDESSPDLWGKDYDPATVETSELGER
jgi:hypothetical protein